MGGPCAVNTWQCNGFFIRKRLWQHCLSAPWGRGDEWSLFAEASMCRSLYIHMFLYWPSGLNCLYPCPRYLLCYSWCIMVFSVTLDYVQVLPFFLFCLVSVFWPTFALLIWFILRSSKCTSVGRFIWQIHKIHHWKDL